MTTSTGQDVRGPNRFWAAAKHYVAIARIDHWFKNVFVLPGVFLALVITEDFTAWVAADILLALMATCLVASANYTINEWLDAEYDRFHPTKKMRPAAQGLVQPFFVRLQYLVLAVSGLAIGAAVSTMVFATLAFLLVMGLAYNCPPVRTKDRAYLDVVSESINNPIRFMIGWFAVEALLLPPSSLLLAYWMGGAFLMAAKRLSEYKFIGDHEKAAQYRRSFSFYNADRLLLSTVFYAITSAFFFGVFLIKYRIELVILSPFLAVLFTWYLKMALVPGSTAQSPEKMYKEKRFVLFVAAIGLLTVVLMLVDLPWLNFLLEYTQLSG